MNRFRNPGLKQSKHTKRPASSAIEYGGSWKMKYRIYHNWLQGNSNEEIDFNVLAGQVY
jgi:hypothetical protein